MAWSKQGLLVTSIAHTLANWHSPVEVLVGILDLYPIPKGCQTTGINLIFWTTTLWIEMKRAIAKSIMKRIDTTKQIALLGIRINFSLSKLNCTRDVVCHYPYLTVISSSPMTTQQWRQQWQLLTMMMPLLYVVVLVSPFSPVATTSAASLSQPWSLLVLDLETASRSVHKAFVVDFCGSKGSPSKVYRNVSWFQDKKSSVSSSSLAVNVMASCWLLA